jgi:hypothetical protein
MPTSLLLDDAFIVNKYADLSGVTMHPIPQFLKTAEMTHTFLACLFIKLRKNKKVKINRRV